MSVEASHANLKKSRIPEKSNIFDQLVRLSKCAPRGRHSAELMNAK